MTNCAAMPAGESMRNATFVPRARFVIAGPKAKSVVDPRSKNGMSAENAAFDVRNKMSAPTRLPRMLVTSIFTSTGRSMSSSLRNDPADVSAPSHIATLFVAFAETGGMPAASAAGNEIKLPPPAPALIALATNAAAKSKTSCEETGATSSPA